MPSDQRSNRRVVIIGAGLQGSGIALELARRGIASTLLERDAHAMNRASVRGEGKIHLGLMYANDRTGATATMMLAGALRFRSIVDAWLPNSPWLACSTPFTYAVADDSLLTPDELEGHFEAVADSYRLQLSLNPSADYLGSRPAQIAWRLPHSGVRQHFSDTRVQAAFGTAELAVDTEVMSRAIKDAIGSTPLIDFRPNHAVSGIEERGDGFTVGGEGPDGTFRLSAEQLVNATWEQRPALDALLGIAPPSGLLHRLKFAVNALLPADMSSSPSVTMLLGRYGDVVVRSGGTAYLSWYPIGLQGWTHDVAPPISWNEPCRGEESVETQEIGARIIKEIDQWYPGIGRSRPIKVHAGAIVAIGTTDVDDRSSSLHDRTHVGVFSRGAYHSVDPGKLTTAPLFAIEAADRIAGLCGRSDFGSSARDSAS